MPRLEYFVVTETSSIDVTRNSVSIFHVLNDIYFDSLPDSLPSLAVISGWIHSEDEIKIIKNLTFVSNFTCQV
jgi:hypothetical protein